MAMDVEAVASVIEAAHSWIDEISQVIGSSP
jgi:hypothetical protein